MKPYQTFALAAALAVTALPVKAADLNITYATFLGPTANLVKDGVVVFLEYVKNNSGGKIDYTLHSGGSLLSGTGMLEGVRDGIADGGQILGVYNPAELPISNVVMGLAPAMTADPRAVVAALTEYTLLDCPKCVAEYEENNIQYIGGWATSLYGLICTKPVNSLADLQGWKLRASGEWAGIGTTLGMSPVTMSLGDTYEGLQRGQVDCTLGEMNWLSTYSYGDIAKYGIELNQGLSYIGPVFSLRHDLWSTLSDEQKQIFYRGTALGMINGAHETVAANEATKEEAKAKGWTIAPGPADVMEKLKEFPAQVRADLIKRSEGIGIEDPSAIIDGFMTKVEKWEEIVKQSKSNEELIEAVMTNIYAKL